MASFLENSKILYTRIYKNNFIYNYFYITYYLPNAAMVHIVVIVIERFRLPSSSNVHILEAPPLGLIPVKNMPICSSGRSGNTRYPMRKLNWKYKIRITV